MKKRISIILGLTFLLFYSCKNDKKKINNVNSEFEFSIQGKVENGEGIELALYIPSKGMDNRIKSTITNGKYIFKGKSNNIERAKIYLDKELAKIGAPRWYFPVFLEPSEQEINFTIYSKEHGNSFLKWAKKESVIKPSNTKFSYDNFLNFFQAKHSSKLDLLKAYDDLFKNTEYKAAQLEYLNVILNKRNFEAEKLTIKEKEKINYLFKKIDTSLIQMLIYRDLKSKVELINKDPNSLKKFKDFTFSDINGMKIKISEIVKDNKFTVLDFWWSGCSPCRKFNKETSLEKYNKLKKEGIELISISTDRSEKQWRNSSKEDNITWINLYAGRPSEIIEYYEVNKYPTKIIFDNQLNIIDFKFLDAAELLKLNDNN